MARLLPHAVVVCLAGATFAAAGLVFGEGIDARVRAGVLGGATAVIVLAAVMVFRRVDAGVEARRRASIRAERVYPLAGPSPLRATLPLRGRGACTVNCWLRGRASGTYELKVRDAASGAEPTVLPLHAGSSSAAWENAKGRAPALAYDEGGPGIYLFAPPGEWSFTLSIGIDATSPRDLRDTLTVEVIGEGAAELPEALS